MIGLVALLYAGAAGAQCTNTPLPAAGIGPVNPANGFPRYYVDASGLALGPCLSLDGLCPLTPDLVPNPLAPIAFPANFPAEWFYWLARARLTLPNGGLGTLTMGVEGSFLNGVVVPGDQITFSRLRIRVSGLVANNTYTVTHPYGVESLTADGLGTINVTFDSRAGAPGFVGPTVAGVSRIGPRYLAWDAAAPAPPAGFVGAGPAVDHTVTGSPCGTNFFRVAGPGLPVGGVQTNFFAVSGRVQDVCGNGILDISEQCDDGNKVAGDCCAPNCTFEPLGSACVAPTICSNNACNGAGGCGFASLNNGLACTDGNVCTVGDTCAGGACIGGARNCDDGNVCTTDICTPPAVGCENLNNAATCDDGNLATSGDVCGGGVCMGFTRRSLIPLNSGENPSVSAAFPAVADIRTDGTRVRASLINMDPARYPAGCSGVTITVGGIQGTAVVSPAVAQGSVPLLRTTAVNFIRTGTAAAGSSAEIRVRCGAHETRWRGTL